MNSLLGAVGEKLILGYNIRMAPENKFESWKAWTHSWVPLGKPSLCIITSERHPRINSNPYRHELIPGCHWESLILDYNFRMAPENKFKSLKAWTHSWVPVGKPNFGWIFLKGTRESARVVKGMNSFLGAIGKTYFGITISESHPRISSSP